MLGLISKVKPTTEGYPQYRTRNSATLDGNDGQYITAAGHADFQLNNVNFSVSGWIKFTEDATSSTDKDGVSIFSALDAESSVNGFVIKYEDQSSDNEYLRAQHFMGGSSKQIAATDNNLADNIWYHFVYTYEILDTESSPYEGTGRVYIDGSIAKTVVEVKTPDNIATSVAASIASANADEVAAKMCEIGFWKGICLSASQVSGIYNNGRPRNLLGVEREYLKGYWRLNAKDDTGSNNVIDYSGADHHGTTASGSGNDLVSGDFDTTDVPK